MGLWLDQARKALHLMTVIAECWRSPGHLSGRRDLPDPLWTFAPRSCRAGALPRLCAGYRPCAVPSTPLLASTPVGSVVGVARGRAPA